MDISSFAVAAQRAIYRDRRLELASIYQHSQDSTAFEVKQYLRHLIQADVVAASNGWYTAAVFRASPATPRPTESKIQLISIYSQAHPCSCQTLTSPMLSIQRWLVPLDRKSAAFLEIMGSRL